MVDISVIMTIYNEDLKWIEKSINSILNQTFKKFEFIIIVDDPDNEEAINLLKQYNIKDRRINFFVNERNIGLTNSLNKALSYSRGRYIARIDADDIAMVDRLEIQFKYLESNKDISLVGGNVIVIDENGNELYSTNLYARTYKTAEKSLTIRNVFWHPTWMFRKEVLDNLIQYHNIPYAEDYDFLCRLVLNNYKICNINYNLCYYRIRKNSITNQNISEQKKIARQIRKKYKKSLKYQIEYNYCYDSSKENISNKNNAYIRYKNAIEYLRNKQFVDGIYNLLQGIILDINILDELFGVVKLKFINSNYRIKLESNSNG